MAICDLVLDRIVQSTGIDWLRIYVTIGNSVQADQDVFDHVLTYHSIYHSKHIRILKSNPFCVSFSVFFSLECALLSCLPLLLYILID